MKPLPPRNYEDIIGLSHHVSPRRPQMSNSGRAAQFAPFAALSGFEESIDETARLTDRCTEPDEEALALLNERMLRLTEAVRDRPEITLLCFEPDEKKPGGAYHSITGRVRRIDEVQRRLILADGTEIPFERIHSIESP
ncbi:MAG: hypothetical protein IJB81_08090 [Clostridia bacterium]|nr:hypothetical protein [Clostridia bacterium]